MTTEVKTHEQQWEEQKQKFNYKYKPKDTKELAEYIDKILEGGWHGYDESVYDGVKCLMALWNYLMDKQGHSGASASFVGLEFLAMSRYERSPFMIMTLEKELYPQYDLHQQLDEFITKNKEWIRQEALEKLKSIDPEYPPHPEVWNRWKVCAMQTTKEKEGSS